MELVFVFTILLGCLSFIALSGRVLFNAMGVFSLHIFALMVPPALFHLFGFELSENYLGEVIEDRAILKLSVIAAVSFIGVLIGYFLFRRFPIGKSLFPDYNYKPSHILMFLGLLALMAFSIVILLMPLSIAGFDVLKTADIIRHGRYFSGGAALRQFQFFANFLSGGFLVYLFRQRVDGERGLNVKIYLTGFLFILNLCISGLLGGKTMIVFPLIFTILAHEICVARRGYRRLILGGVIVLSLIISLQLIRTQWIKQSDRSFEDSAYVGLYYVLYDSTLLYLDTDKVLHHTEMGQDFVNGVLAAVPRALWPDKPEKQIMVGSRFRAQILYTAEGGGWPVYGFAQWYVNFGWFGVLIGGMLSGLLLAVLQSRYHDYRDNPFSFMIMCHVIFLLMGPWPGGLHSFFLPHYILFVLPLFLFKFFTKRMWLKMA